MSLAEFKAKVGHSVDVGVQKTKSGFTKAAIFSSIALFGVALQTQTNVFSETSHAIGKGIKTGFDEAGKGIRYAAKETGIYIAETISAEKIAARAPVAPLAPIASHAHTVPSKRNVSFESSSTGVQFIATKDLNKATKLDEKLAKDFSINTDVVKLKTEKGEIFALRSAQFKDCTKINIDSLVKLATMGLGCTTYKR